MTDITVGFAFCGSFCTFDKAIAVLEKVCDKYHNVLPILSETAAATDSRYGAADDFVRELNGSAERRSSGQLPGRSRLVRRSCWIFWSSRRVREIRRRR
jgi:dipicolinate synthase subunit B